MTTIFGFGMFGSLLPNAFKPPPTNFEADCAIGVNAFIPNLITLLPKSCALLIVTSIFGEIVSLIVFKYGSTN